jgi:hypothetical protein
MFGQTLNQKIELLVTHAEVQRISNRLGKIELPILAKAAE